MNEITNFVLYVNKQVIVWFLLKLKIKILDLHVETDWWLLTVQVLQEDVNSIPIQDGESIIYVAILSRC